MGREHIYFVTGKLAEPSLRHVLVETSAAANFDYSVGVLGISVAALMTPDWVARFLAPPAGATRVMLPGFCQGDLAPVEKAAGLPVVRGPKDLRDLPEWFTGRARSRDNYGRHDIEIIAEINHAPRLARDELLSAARALAADGADWIDLGCNPGETWRGVGDAVRALRDAGLRVSIDSMNADEIEPAIDAGAELVLSVNSTNIDRAIHWRAEVVIVPDVADTLTGIAENYARLREADVRARIDPVLSPIGFGFAASLGRYLETRRLFPDAEMMMGIGNLTELTDADSAAINVLLLGFCQEVGIRSVLTTQVINWARSSVKECDLARRLVYHAVTARTLPKHAEPRLVLLRDPRVHEHGAETLEQLARDIKDPNYRIFAERGELHVISANLYLRGTDPFELLARLQATTSRPLEAAHAFYLGYELAKAHTALTLGKDYRQDQSLDWGFLTIEEKSHGQKKA
ncbi:MAG TPA: DUF6513 domain-containing protein [Pirellulales bacterium]|jgi:dihydropteroate synthase-like protein